jgi:hypothetical protein
LIKKPKQQVTYHNPEHPNCIKRGQSKEQFISLLKVKVRIQKKVIDDPNRHADRIRD